MTAYAPRLDSSLDISPGGRLRPPMACHLGPCSASAPELAAYRPAEPACRRGTQLRVCLGIVQYVSVSACARPKLTRTWRPRYGNPVRNPG